MESGVTDAAAQAGAPPAAGGEALTSPWLIAVLVALATFMEVLDTTIANTVLPYFAGSMGVSDDEAAWVVTTYLVANAVSLEQAGQSSRQAARPQDLLSALPRALQHKLDSVRPGLEPQFPPLVPHPSGPRRRQHGAGVAVDFGGRLSPAEKRGQAFALFGVAVVVAPVVGPTLGGWLADTYTWRWCFLINGPVGLATIALIAVLLPADKPNETKQARFDVIGFLLVATFLGALEIVLDRGLEDDWFSSSFIVTFTVICALAFVLMIPWETSRRDPMIDVRMVGSRQFGAGFLVMGAIGAILYATTQFLPLMVQTEFGYTATWAGLMLSPGGLVTLVMMFIVGQLSSRIQPKYLIMTGAIFVAFSMHQLTNVYGDVDFWFLARTRMALGVGLPLIFIPIIAASYAGIPANRVDMASALINAARNTGGSIGVAMASNVLAHREQFHRSRLIEHVTPSSPQYQNTLHQVSHYFAAQGFSPSAAQARAMAWIGRQVRSRWALVVRGRVLGADAARPRRRAAGDDPAQGQARRSGAGSALRHDRRHIPVGL